MFTRLEILQVTVLRYTVTVMDCDISNVVKHKSIQEHRVHNAQNIMMMCPSIDFFM